MDTNTKQCLVGHFESSFYTATTMPDFFKYFIGGQLFERFLNILSLKASSNVSAYSSNSPAVGEVFPNYLCCYVLLRTYTVKIKHSKVEVQQWLWNSKVLLSAFLLLFLDNWFLCSNFSFCWPFLIHFRGMLVLVSNLVYLNNFHALFHWECSPIGTTECVTVWCRIIYADVYFALKIWMPSIS